MKEYVIAYYPDARIEDTGGLYHVLVSINGLGYEDIIGKGITEDEAWYDAWDWVDLRK